MNEMTGEVAAPTEVEKKLAALEAEFAKSKTVKVRQSETMGKLALALSKAQGQMEDAKKDANNPFYGSKYADLASVWSAVRKPLSDNEIAVFARVIESSSTKVTVETMLRHSSDEWYLTEVTVPITAISKDREKVVIVTAQHIGSGITYCRRYGLQCVTGNAPAEDDGNTASGKTNEGVVQAQPHAEGPPPSAPPQARAATAIDYAERTKLMAEVAAAPDEKTLTLLVERISKLPEDQKTELRKLYGARVKELKGQPAPKSTPPTTPLAPAAFAGESATDRAARAAMDAARAATEKTPPAEVTHFPEPGSEG